jgi:hypothetical protein
MVWDPSTKKKVPIVNATWLGYDYTTSEGQQNQVIRWETKQNLIDQGIHINDNYDHWGWDGPDAKVATIHVPIKSIIDNLDQYGVGQSQENKNRMNIEVGGSVRQTLQEQQMESLQEQEFLNAGKIGN